MKCSNCQAELRPGARFCESCGAGVPAAAAAPASATVCPRCRAQVPAAVTYCPSCGARQPTAAEQQPATPAPQGGQRAPRSVTTGLPHPPEPPAPPKARRRGRGCCIAILVPVGLVAALLTGAVALLLLAPETLSGLLNVPISVTVREASGDSSIRTPVADARPASNALTNDQQRLVERLSYPDSFVVVIGPEDPAGSEGNTRLEIWSYHVLGTCFTFEDGVFRGIDEALRVDGPAEYPSLRPEQFYEGMTIDDVNRVVGDIPLVGAEIVPDIAEGMDVYVYDQGVVVAFAGGSLAYASTEWALPVDLP